MNPKVFQKRKPFAVFSHYDPDAAAYFAVVASRGGSISTARKVKINDGIIYLKTEGQFSLLDRLCIYVNTDEVAALTSMVNPSVNISEVVNSPTFTPEVGYVFNGTTQYLKTRFTPSVNGVNFTLASAMFGAYFSNLPSGDGSRINLGVTDIASGTIFFAALSANYSEVRTGSISGGVSANVAGMAVGNCFGYNAGVNGGVLIGGISSNVYASQSVTQLTTKEVFIGALNNNDTGASNFFFGGAQKYHIFGSGSVNMVKLNFAMNNYFLA